MTLRNLDLGTRKRLVVSFTTRSLYPGTHWIGGWSPEAVWTRWRRRNSNH